MFRILILIVIFLCQFYSFTFSQTPELDSLYLLLDRPLEDSTKSEVLQELSKELMSVSLTDCLDITNQRLDIAIKMKDGEQEGRAYIWKGRVLGELNRLDSALVEFDNAEKMFLNPMDSFYIAEIYNGKGIINKYKGEYEIALELQYKSANISELIGMYENAASTYNSLGNIYGDLGQVKKAIEFYKKSIANLEKAGGNYYGIAGASFNLGNMLDDDPKEKMRLFNKAEKICLEHGYNRVLGYLYNGKAEHYGNNLNKVDSQKYFFIKANYFATKANDKYMMAYSQLYLGSMNYQSEPKKAYEDIQNALESEFIKDDRFLKAEGYKYLSKALFYQKKYKDAYIQLDTAKSLYQKIYDIDVAKAGSEANAKYETEKKDTEIAKQEIEILKEKSNTAKIIGGGAFLLLLVCGIFIWYFERQKRKKKEAEVALVQKQMEARKFKELDVLKNQFFTNITHELRTPLTLIMGPLVNALEKSDNPELTKDLHLAQNNTHRLLDMINEILDLSKLESGKVPINEDIVEVYQFFRRILYSFQSVAEMNHVKLEFETDLKKNTGVVLDIEKVETILNNLLSNALKFSPSHEKIKMILIQRNKAISIKIQDYGVGIPQNEQEHIFNRFYQASNTNTGTQGGGTGVGLALSKSLAILMKGDLTVESELDNGSCFILKLPTFYSHIKDNYHGSVHPLDVKTYYEPILFNGEKPHVLIIEDNTEMQVFLKDILIDSYKVTMANDGYDGLKKIQTNNFDLVSCDVMMPKMDGFTLKEKSNELNLLNDIPFIFLTAKVLEEDRLRGLRLGVDDYIAKPFNKYEYKARIYNLLSNRKSRIDYLSVNTDYALQNIDSIEQQILKKAELLIREKVSDQSLKVSDLASELNYSQRQLSRVIKKLTGMTAVQFILELRLQRAYLLMQSKAYSTVNEVMYEVGIESPSYFTRKFKERFGVNAGEVIDY